MIREYSGYYSQASAILPRILSTFDDIHFDERDQAVEVFAAQALSMSRDHCQAISLLLDADLFAESFAICRFLFELTFDLVWIDSTEDRREKLERVYQLEADPYFQMSREVKLLEMDVNSPTPHTSKEMFQQFERVLEQAKRGSPYLTVPTAQAKVEFKQVPPLVKRMGDEFRIQYYHVYRFTCLFTHPTPMLKRLHLQMIGQNRTIPELIEEPLKETLAYGLFFVEIIAKIAAKLLTPYDLHKSNVPNTCCQQLFQLAEKANKGWFGTAKDKKADQQPDPKDTRI